MLRGEHGHLGGSSGLGPCGCFEFDARIIAVVRGLRGCRALPLDPFKPQAFISPLFTIGLQREERYGGEHICWTGRLVCVFTRVRWRFSTMQGLFKEMAPLHDDLMVDVTWRKEERGTASFCLFERMLVAFGNSFSSISNKICFLVVPSTK